MERSRGLRVGGLVGVLLSGVLGACGTPPARDPVAPAKPGAQAASSGELSEVGSFVDHGAPDGMLFWVRVPAPGRDIPLLSTLLSIGSMFDPNEVATRKLGPVLGRTVDFSKPFDLTTSGLGDGPMRVVLAAGIFDSDSFLSQVSSEFEVVHEGRGRWQLVPKGKPRPGALRCELWHAARPVGARLLCATHAELLEQQGEFLMATARTNVDRNNFHAELPGKAALGLIRKSAAEQASQRRVAEDSDYAAGQAMGEQWFSDWVRDSSGYSWDLTLRRDSVELSQEMGFSRSDFWLSTAISGRAGTAKAVPEAFWQLPNDSDAALYFEGAEPEPMRRQAASMIHTVRLALEKSDELTPPDKFDQFEQTVARLILRGGSLELAYGRDLNQAARALNEAAEHAAARGPRSGSADPALKKAQTQLAAWGLLGVEDDSRAYLQALRDGLRLATDKTKSPPKKDSKPSSPSPSSLYFGEVPLPASAGLPVDSAHFVVRSEPNAKYVAAKAKPAAPAPSAYHVIVVADAAQHLWIAVASDEALALTKLRAVLSPESPKTLGASEELRQLAKQQPVAGLGFVTLAAVNGIGLSAASKDKVRTSRFVLKQLWGLPKHGSTRMPIWITRSQGAAGQRRIAYNVRLTPDAIADLLAIFMGPAAVAEGPQDE